MTQDLHVSTTALKSGQQDFYTLFVLCEGNDLQAAVEMKSATTRLPRHLQRQRHLQQHPRETNKRQTCRSAGFSCHESRPL